MENNNQKNNIEYQDILNTLEVILKNMATKDDLAGLDKKIDDVEFRLTQKIDDVETKLTKRIDDVETRLTERIDVVDTKLELITSWAIDNSQEIPDLEKKLKKIQEWVTIIAKRNNIVLN